MPDRTSLTFAEGTTGMMENVFLDVKNESKTITAGLEVPAGGPQYAARVIVKVPAEQLSAKIETFDELKQ